VRRVGSHLRKLRAFEHFTAIVGQGCEDVAPGFPRYLRQSSHLCDQLKTILLLNGKFFSS
jgi:hypothetical protein